MGTGIRTRMETQSVAASFLVLKHIDQTDMIVDIVSHRCFVSLYLSIVQKQYYEFY